MERNITNHRRGDSRESYAVVVGVLSSRSARLFSGSGTLARLAVISLAATLLAGCPSSKTTKFREDVQLSTGEVITVSRETRHLPGGGDLSRGSGWRPDAYIIRFNYPKDSTASIEWRSIKQALETGITPEMPLVLDYDTSQTALYVISINWLRGGCFEYVRYFYRNGTWVEDRLPDEFQAMPANLFIGSARLHPPSHVKLAVKHKDLDQYKMRLRQVGPKQTDCKA